MGILTDYFRAGSDVAAAAAVENGPAGAFDTVEAKGILPPIMTGILESLLTGRSYEDAGSDVRNADLVCSSRGDRQLVLTVTDTLTRALAEATPEQLSAIALPWSESEEFWGQGDPVFLGDLLTELSGMAGRAVEADDRLYCWVSV